MRYGVIRLDCCRWENSNLISASTKYNRLEIYNSTTTRPRSRAKKKLQAAIRHLKSPNPILTRRYKSKDASELRQEFHCIRMEDVTSSKRPG